MTQDQWLIDRVAYIRGLKAPSDLQRLLMILSEKQDRTADENRKMTAILRAEKATERAQKARANAARIIDADKEVARKARDHELFNAAGLMSLAGLLDKTTGTPLWDRGVLLGALVSLAEANIDDAKKAAWKNKGDALLTKPPRKTL